MTGPGPDGPLVERMRPYTSSIFSDMSALAAATGAINLGQGFPDTDGPDEVLEAAVAAVRGGANQYPPGAGRPELRAAVADHQFRRYGLEVDPDEGVVVTMGASEALAAAVLGLCGPGDEVVVLEPYFDLYAAVIDLAGATRRGVTLRAPEFRLEPDDLRAVVTPRTRMVLLNTPHNPTGRVLDDDELAAVAAVCREHDLVVVTDEVYEHLTFDGRRHRPLATLPGMAERTLTISSAGKTFSVTGWKVGWATGPAPLVTAVRTVKQNLSYSGATPFQVAVAHALGLPDGVVGSVRDTLEARRDQLCAGLASIGARVFRPEATYFVTVDVRSLGAEDGLAFCRELPSRAGVVAIPNVVFYDDVDEGRPLVRFACCKRADVLDEAVQRLAAAFT